MKRKKITITVLSLLLICVTVSLIFLLRNYKADVVNNGESQVENLVTNWQDYQDKGSTEQSPQISKYEKFELTFDVNWYHNRDFTNPGAKYDPISNSTINPYWPYDPNPTPNQYFSANHPEWDVAANYAEGSNHVQKNNVIYAATKSTPGSWTTGTKYYKNNVLKYSDGNLYINTTTNSSGDVADDKNKPDGAGSLWQLKGTIVEYLTPGDANNKWQEYWLVNPPDPIPAGKGITVNGIFTNVTSDKTVTQPAFIYQDYAKNETNPDYTFNGGKKWLYPNGKLVWKIRFAPTETDIWQYKISITDASGTTEYIPSPSSLTVVNSTNRGFAKVSEKDSRYFETSDGTVLPMIGLSGSGDDMTKLKDMGVNFVRDWWQSSNPSHSLFGNGGQGGDGIWNVTSYSTAHITPGHITSAVVPTIDSIGSCWKTINQTAPVKKNKTYKLKALVKTINLQGTGDYGLFLAESPSLQTSAKITGSTNGWQEISMNINSGNKETLRIYIAGLNNTSGEMYISDLSLKEDLGTGDYGSELLIRPDLQPQTSYSNLIAWEIDQFVELAKENNIYIKAVLEEKNDNYFPRINKDGSFGTLAESKIYADANSANRQYQIYYWRYIIARYGYSTAIHSFELLNEGNPFDGNHYNAANAFADYFHTNDDHRHLVSTSFWHSIPQDFWKTSSCDYIDLHEYFGPQTARTGSHGPRHYAWLDGQNTPVSVASGSFDFDSNTMHSGSKSLKLTAKDGAVDNNSNWFSTNEYHVGIDPTHKYTLRYWAKGENIGNAGGGLAWTRPSVGIVWSSAYHENDFKGWPTCKQQNPGLGTYDWSEFYCTDIVPPSTANTANINAITTRNQPGSGDGTFWVDDVSFIDQTTNQELFVDGSFEGDRIDYDVALAVQKYTVLAESYGQRINKPMIWGETGIRGPKVNGDTYQGFGYTEENQQLVDDTEGIWWKKWVWANVSAGSVNSIYWWGDLPLTRNYTYAKSYKNFMSGIKLSSGKYSDIKTTTSSTSLRAWGQKETDPITNKADKAHLWIDNAPYTWKNVVDAKAGTATLASPISGSVAVSDMIPSKTYKLEWWDTSKTTNQILIDASLPKSANSDENGNLSFRVDNLASDIALKISISEIKILDSPTTNVSRNFTYKSRYSITGTKSNEITKLSVNDIDIDVPANTTTWTKEVDLPLGTTAITIIGKDDAGNQSDLLVVSITRRKSGDSNNDAKIDIKDFATLMFNWNKNDNSNVADFNEDNKIGMTDLSIMMANWGR